LDLSQSYGGIRIRDIWVDLSNTIQGVFIAGLRLKRAENRMQLPPEGTVSPSQGLYAPKGLSHHRFRGKELCRLRQHNKFIQLLWRHGLRVVANPRIKSPVIAAQSGLAQ
jgi:hypothetical protein